MLRATNIQWDFDGEPNPPDDVPTEINIPAGMTDEEEISDYITEQTGWCHKGFTLETVGEGA